MPKLLRIAVLTGGLLAFLLAAGFFLEAAWATWIWPVPSSRLPNIFVSSILASIGAPVVWIALADEPRAMAGGAIDLSLSSAAIMVAAYVFYRNGGPPGLLPFAAFAAILLALNVGLSIYSRRLPFRDTRPTPAVVRYSFAGFSLALLLAGTALVMTQRNIFPWPIEPAELGVLRLHFPWRDVLFPLRHRLSLLGECQGAVARLSGLRSGSDRPLPAAFLHGAPGNAPEPDSLHRRRCLQRPARDLLPVPASGDTAAGRFGLAGIPSVNRYRLLIGQMMERTRTENEPKLFIPKLARFYHHMIPLSWVIVRIAVGLNLAIHGFGKIGRSGGPRQLVEKLPQSAAIGDEITFVLMLIEFVGGLCIMAGLFTRFWAAAAAVEMAVLTFYIYGGSGFGWLSRGYEYTLMWGLVLFAVALRGGGPLSLDRRLGREL